MSDQSNDDTPSTLDDSTMPLNEAVTAENIGKLIRTPTIIVSEGDPRAVPIRATCYCRHCAIAVRANRDLRPTEVVGILYNTETREIVEEQSEQSVFHMILGGQMREASRLMQTILQHRGEQLYRTNQEAGTAPECTRHAWVFSWDMETSLNVIPSMVRMLLKDELAFYSIRQARDYHTFFLFRPPMEMRLFLWAVPFPNPSQKNRIDLIIVNSEPIEEDRLELTPEEIDEWKSIFQEEDLTKLMNVIDESIAPRIVQRELYKISTFLAIHSPLWFYQPTTNSDGENILIRAALRFNTYGDTATAKTEVMSWCEKQLKLGEVVRAETGTRAGMYYHVNTELKALYWGVVPQNDGGMVYMDGLQGYSPEEMAKLREVFSHQKIKVQMMVSGEAWARVRMISAANTSKPMRRFLYPCQGIVDIRPFSREYSLPDIRRWDGWVPAAQEDVETKAIADARLPINNPHSVEIISPIDPELIRKHILWAWSLLPGEICIDPEAQKALNDAFIAIKNQYESPSIPIVGADSWQTLTRWSIAVAVVRHNWNEETKKVHVDKKAVDIAIEFIRNMYDTLELADYVEFEKGKGLLQSEIDDILLGLDDIKSKILQELARRSMNSEELGAIVGLKAQSLRTNHLGKLRGLELVSSGTRKGFELTNKGVELLRILKNLKFKLPEGAGETLPEDEEEESGESFRCTSCGDYHDKEILMKHPYDTKGKYCKECISKLTPEGGALDDF